MFFTLSIRKILVMLRAMKVACTRARSQKRRKCREIASEKGSGPNIAEINKPTHWKYISLL